MSSNRDNRGDSNSNGLSEVQQAMMLFHMMEQVMASENEEEEQEPDDRVQCPVCSKCHEPREGEKDAAKKGEPASHGCLVIYIEHYCPICLENAGPPMVALPCGHIVCQPHFEKLGGWIGERPSDRPSTDTRAEQRRSQSGGRTVDMDSFISGLNMMRMMGMPTPFGFPGLFGEDDEDDDDDYQDDSDDESCPPLERVGGGGLADTSDNEEESDSDDSMPPLEPVRRGETIAAAATSGNNAENTDDDDDSMSDLQRMDSWLAYDDDGDDDDSMPPLMPRAIDSDQEADDEKEEDDDGMPPLTARPRSGYSTGNQNAPVASSNNNTATASYSAGTESDSDDSCPPLERVGMDDSSDDEGPPVRRRATTVTVAVAASRNAPNSSSNVRAGSHFRDDGDGMPTLTRRKRTDAGNKPDKEGTLPRGEISEIEEDEDDEEEVIPFPELDHIRGASRAPTTFSREEYLALPESERDMGSGGAWIMIPSNYHEDYSTLVYTNEAKCIYIGIFARESRMIVNDNKSVLISSPTSGSNQSDVLLVTVESTEVKYKVPSNAQCVSDGDSGVWVLTPTSGTKELAYYNADSPTGNVVHMLPESSYLVFDPMGGVWAHVRKKGSLDVEPGLYYYVYGMGHNLIAQPAQDARCSPGADGVCVISSVVGKATLTNTVLGETARPSTLKNCAASKDIRVIPREKEEGDRSLYVHCRVQNRWKLCILDGETSRLSVICDTPKDARVVADGKGGAWVFKRTGASHQMRMLQYITSSGATRDHGLSFPPGSKIAGL